MVSAGGSSMAKRVLLVRGGALGRNTGLGAAHHNLVDMLKSGKVTGWQLAGVCEYPLAKTSNPLSRIWNRWFSHPKRVIKKIRNQSGEFDLVHITDQEQAHLVPKDSTIPVAITVHDLFHMFPEKLRFNDDIIDVGDMTPGIFRRRDLNKLKQGINRANFLMCNSRHTLNAAKANFPKVKSSCIPLGINSAKYHPDNQELVDISLPEACNLLVVGSNDPRKRMKFLCQVIAQLPDEVRQGIHIHHVGNSAANSGLPSIAELVKFHGLTNWTIHGSSVSDEYLMTLRIKCNALLFPSVSEGFGYPPIESMAAGMKVICADLPSHNELMPKNSCIPADDMAEWVKAITSLHDNYQSNDGESNIPQIDLIDHAKKYDNSVFCQRLSEAYNSFVA